MTAAYAKKRFVYANIIKEIAENNNAGVVKVSSSIVGTKIINNQQKKVLKKSFVTLYKRFNFVKIRIFNFLCLKKEKQKTQ